MPLKVLGGAFIALAVAGCAVYRPAPLQPASDASLAQPDLSVIAAQAAAVRHPRLAPVVIALDQPLTPRALGLLAVIVNPDLKAARAQAQVADAQVFDAGLLPDPSLTLGTDQLLSGPDTHDAYLGQIALDLNAFRTRQVSRAIARAARAQVRYDLAWQEWQTAGQARLLAVRIGGLTRALALDHQTSDAAEVMLQRVLAAAARGDVKADEVETRRLAASDASDKTRQAERDLAAARMDLNRLLGLRPETVLNIDTTPPPLPTLDADALFAKARDQRLDLLALQAGYDSQEASLRKVVMDQFPNLQLTVSRAQDTTGNQTLGPQISLTLPIWNRNRGGIAIASATRAQLKAEYAARLLATRADIADLVAGLAIAKRQRDAMAAQLAPLQVIAAQAEAAADRGDIARAASDATRQAITDKALALSALDQTLAEQTIALELAVGAALTE